MGSPWIDFARQVLPLSARSELLQLEAQDREAKEELAISIAELQIANAQQRTIATLLSEKTRTVNPYQATVLREYSRRSYVRTLVLCH